MTPAKSAYSVVVKGPTTIPGAHVARNHLPGAEKYHLTSFGARSGSIMKVFWYPGVTWIFEILKIFGDFWLAWTPPVGARDLFSPAFYRDETVTYTWNSRNPRKSQDFLDFIGFICFPGSLDLFTGIFSSRHEKSQLQKRRIGSIYFP